MQAPSMHWSSQFLQRAMSFKPACWLVFSGPHPVSSARQRSGSQPCPSSVNGPRAYNSLQYPCQKSLFLTPLGM